MRKTSCFVRMNFVSYARNKTFQEIDFEQQQNINCCIVDLVQNASYDELRK